MLVTLQPLLFLKGFCSDNHVAGLNFTSAFLAIGCTNPAPFLGMKSLGSAPARFARGATRDFVFKCQTSLNAELEVGGAAQGFSYRNKKKPPNRLLWTISSVET